jgi:hypothetical protein
MPNIRGKIIGSISVMRYTVRLDDGADIEAILPKSALRKVGCLFGPLQNGQVVTVSLRDLPRQNRIVDVTNAR